MKILILFALIATIVMLAHRAGRYHPESDRTPA